MAEAKATADAIAASTSEEAFLAAVAGAAGDKKYLKDDSLTLTEDASSDTVADQTSDYDAAEWLFSDEAVAGATYVTEQASVGYTVYYVTEAVHKPAESLTYSVRHILVKFPDDADEVEDEEIDVDTEEAADEAEEAKEETKEEITVTALDTKAYDDVTIDLDVDGDSATDKETYQKAQNIL